MIFLFSSLFSHIISGFTDVKFSLHFAEILLNCFMSKLSGNNAIATENVRDGHHGFIFRSQLQAFK